jgi:hypothetical protein
MVSIDNILIYTHDMKQYKILVKEASSRLHAWNLAASIDKYEFHLDTVEFLGYIISQDGIAMSEEKMKINRSLKSPKI